MRISDLITPQRVACNVSSASKKRALERLSELLVNQHPELDPVDVFESLINRERLGSTGLGKGIALPHGRMKQGKQAIAAFMQLRDSVDFDAPDGRPVDLLFALLVPPESSEEHLEILALLSEMFRDPELRDQLRRSHDQQQVYRLLTEWKKTTP